MNYLKKALSVFTCGCLLAASLAGCSGTTKTGSADSYPRKDIQGSVM